MEGRSARVSPSPLLAHWSLASEALLRLGCSCTRGFKRRADRGVPFRLRYEPACIESPPRFSFPQTLQIKDLACSPKRLPYSRITLTGTVRQTASWSSRLLRN